MTNREIINLLKNNKVKITKYIPYPYRVYFTINDERYMLGSGFGDLYEEYSMFAKVDGEKRKIIEVLAYCDGCIEVTPYLYNGKPFKCNRGYTYSKINIDDFITRVIYEYNLFDESDIK